MDRTEGAMRHLLAAIEAPLYDVGVLSSRGMLPGLDTIPAATVLRRLPLLKYRNARGSHYATALKRAPLYLSRRPQRDCRREAHGAGLRSLRPAEQAGSLSLCSVSGVSAGRAKNIPALWTHALLASLRCALGRCGLLPRSESGSPSADQFQSPREGMACHTLRVSMYRRQQDKPQETEPNTLFNKVILIGRLGHNAEAKTAQNNREYVVLSIATQESWRNDKGDYETRTEWHRVLAWGNPSRFARTLAKGQLVSLEGTLKYRESPKTSRVFRSSTASRKYMPSA